MTTGTLDGWQVLITGGGSGIGLGCAARFLADGATVTLMGRTRERLEQAAATLDAPEGRVRLAVGDVAVEDDVAKAVAVASAVEGGGERLDVAVASAGTGTMAPVIAQDAAEFDRVMKTNLYGTLYTFKHAGGVIAGSGGGAMCAISSIAGARTHQCGSAYCASKAAIDSLVQNAADELGRANVRVNSVLPGLVETDLSQGLQDDAAMLEDYLEWHAGSPDRQAGGHRPGRALPLRPGGFLDHRRPAQRRRWPAPAPGTEVGEPGSPAVRRRHHRRPDHPERLIRSTSRTTAR
ncbi:MAG: SDR family NAD(P)-dependent oxidoreductase [Gammaproteobacteria bacterium]|nr:SDR family NAD(P)-dependent oxidoreductase [Gammaproteobacteria bacterium]